MAQCLPGMPCYDVKMYTSDPNCGCKSDVGPCTIYSDRVEYAGPNLPNTGIQNLEDLSTALQKIDERLNSENIFNLILQVLDTNPELKALLCDKLSSC